jgi:hypothetical protein
MDHSSKKKNKINIFSVGLKYYFHFKKFYCRVNKNRILIPALIQGNKRKNKGKEYSPCLQIVQLCFLLNIILTMPGSAKWIFYLRFTR